ncbi:MAG: class I SAM-dependent DNA methyltransferase [Candidatus Scalindua sp.]
MPLKRKQIRNNAHAFVIEWKGETRENAEAKPFWEAFFRIFGVNRRRFASFEEPVKKVDNITGFIDLLWKGKLLIEHKSKGKDLDKAYTQAIDYFPGLKDVELPRYVLVSDFDRFRLYDLDSDARFNFIIDDLPDNIHLFDFIAGYEDVDEKFEEYELNIKAAEKLGALHDSLLESGYSGHHLEIFLVRILFCIFAEDTGIFVRHQFINYLINFTQEDGTDTEMHLAKLFQILDKDDATRNQNLSEELNAFPYVNGHLFAERIDMPSFSSEMREMLIECAYFDWGSISPAIFGSLFQSVMDKEIRRNLGAHYTSEKNILRLIKPLFLDELHERINKIQGMKQPNKKQQALIDYQKELSKLEFLDPACGCGNFLVITYREIRRLELLILEEQQKVKLGEHFELEIDPLISLDHFHGIEIEEWPVRIAEVAMWLTQHQMNREFAKQFGREPDLLPLITAAHIIHGNALQIEWNEVVAKKDLNYIIGNPPFRGSKFQSKEQKKELDKLFNNVPNAKQLDYVSCWYVKAAQIMEDTEILTAFVSTNSITQGEQVEPLWQSLLAKGVHIVFAHRTFSWYSEAKGKASVHVVIIGFSLKNRAKKIIYEYPDTQGGPIARNSGNINPYLIDAEELVIGSRSQTLCNVPPLWFGNMPLDGGNLLLTPEEKDELLASEPGAEKWLKKVLGAREFLNDIERWCLWLVSISPSELRKLPEIKKRVEQVKAFRLASKAKSSRIHADRPTEFRDTRISGTYILIPSVSSERREYVPMGFFDGNTISTNLNLIVPEGTLYHFGVLESRMHMDWMRVVAGKLKSDYRYSAKLVYNNFPWPEIDKEQKQMVESVAQVVLNIRENYPDSSLADLYDPLTMPADLRKAHQQLDKAVDTSYRKEPFNAAAERLQFLFNEYSRLTKKESQGEIFSTN